MIANLTATADTARRADFDVAIGILVGLRRISAEQANHEIVSCAVAHNVSLFPLCRSLLALASGQSAAAPASAAFTVAEQTWGSLFADRTWAPASVA